MDSLVGYGSDDDNETDRYTGHQYPGPCATSGSRRRDDDTNYDDVNMDMSEDSQAESEPELPSAPVERAPKHPRDDRRSSSKDDSRGRGNEHDRRDRRRDSPSSKRPDRDRDRDRERARDHDRDRDRRSPRRDERTDRHRSERGERSRNEGGSRRGLLGDRPTERSSDTRSSDSKVPALMDLKPFGGEAPPAYSKSQDARDAVSPRFTERSDRAERREKDKGRERDRERHGRRSEERRSGSKHQERDRSRSRGAAFPPPAISSSSSSERRGSPPSASADYRPSSYKVNKKLEVMEKMGLQIKTPDGSMATAQQLRAAASEAPAPTSASSFYNSGSMNSAKILDQVQKRKLLWSNKNKSEAEEASKWSGTRFAQDNDGKQVSKFMRLMGIKDPEKVKPEPDKAVDPIKKQEELFQAMQAQYEVARATTHTMRGVGLGFQRGQY